MAPSRKRVLVALPTQAVDRQRAKLLKRCQSSLLQRQCLICPLLRVVQPVAMDITVLEFDFPKGEPLSKRLETACFAEVAAQSLCRDLLSTVLRLKEVRMTFSGLMDASMVYVDGDCRVTGLLPVGCILSSHGVQRAITGIVSGKCAEHLAPELLEKADFVHHTHDCPAVCLQWDNFVVAAIVLQALLLAEPASVNRACVRQALSDASGDFLCKALHWEPQWRLCGEKALAHPWLA